MLKENQIVKVRRAYNGTNDYLDEKYTVSEDGYYYIDPHDLLPSSHVRVAVICDNEDCKRELGMEYRQYYHKSQKYGDGKYYCKYCAAKTPEIKHRRVEGMLNTYGVENAMFDPELKKKCMESCSQNDSVPTSKAQLKMYEFLLEDFPNTYLNYVEGNTYLDCAVYVDDIKIDVEYDGWYWHQDKEKDDKRDMFIHNQGYKILRVKGGKQPPNKQDLIATIKTLINSEEIYTELILSDYKEITN